MNKSLQIYAVVVAAGALAFCGLLDWSVLTELSPSDWVGLATFVALAILAQSLEVNSTVGGNKPVTVSIAFLPLLALAVVLPAPAVVMAAGAMAIVRAAFLQEWDWGRGVFNTSQTVLSYGIGVIAYEQLILVIDSSTASGFGSLANIFLPFLGLATTFFGLNLLFVAGWVSLRQREKFIVVLSAAMGRGGGNLLYDLFASPFALFAAVLYQNYHVGGLLIVVLPLLLIRHSYLSAIQLQQANRDLLKVLVKTIETRDPYTSGHSLRVSRLARMIALDFGLRGTAVSHIENAALLHDIGKIDLDYAQVIAKPSELSEEERRLIQSHATRGADLLESLTSLEKPIIMGVRHHHEHFDGTGYPSGLVGKDIPLAGRIIMICDAVDAMLSDRPYRNALPLSHVRSELSRCSGAQFDPDLVKVILEGRTLENAEVLVDRGGARQPPSVAVVS
jgi:putative nucleotidyltransferase with HDIG domain